MSYFQIPSPAKAFALILQVGDDGDMNLGQEIRDMKFRLNRVEAGIDTILEAEAIILKAIQNGDNPNPISREQWLERLRQIQQDKQHDKGA